MSTHAPHARGDTGTAPASAHHAQFQPTPLMRGATPWCSSGRNRARVSTPAPHARGDALAAVHRVVEVAVSTHAPHARGDVMHPGTLGLGQFQPTPLMRGATMPLKNDDTWDVFQPTPLMRGATLCKALAAVRLGFQPTPLMRGATHVRRADWPSSPVSTHAPHARGDVCC